MSGVFINYREKDEPYGAAGIYADLVGRFGPEQVFRDCDSLRPADHYPTVIKEKLRSSEVVLAIIGPEWLELKDEKTDERLIDRAHDWVRAEIADALSRGIPVIPVFLHDTTPPGLQDLPSSIAGLATSQGCRIHYRSYPDDVERLAKSIMTLVPGVAIPQLFEKPVTRPARWLPSALLRPEYEVIPLADHDGTLANLHNWATGSAQASARLLRAPAGRGKTRLAQKLCTDLEKAGWITGFAQESLPATAFSGTTRITKPLLLVIDDAEFRTDQVAAAARLLTEHPGERSAPRRLLLLSRQKDWLPRLYQNPDKQIADVFRGMTEATLDTFSSSVTSRRTEFLRAAARFAEALDRPVPGLTPQAELAEPKFGSTLLLHASALAALLDESGTTDGGDQDAMTRLRQHEYRYWARFAAELDQTRLHVTAAAATLYGAPTPEQARTLLAALPQFTGAGQDTIDAYLNWMTTNYPGRQALNPVEPRRIGEDHLAVTMAGHPDFVTAPARVATDHQLSRAFVTLSRTALRHPNTAQAIDDLLSIDPDRLLVMALNALRRCDDGRPLVEAIKARFKSVRPGTLINFFDQMYAAGPSVFPLLYELSQAIVSKAAPNTQPAAGEPLHKFAQVVNNLTKTVVEDFGSAFTSRDTTSEDESGQRPTTSGIFDPNAMALLKEMWFWRDRFPPTE